MYAYHSRYLFTQWAPTLHCVSHWRNRYPEWSIYLWGYYKQILCTSLSLPHACLCMWARINMHVAILWASWEFKHRIILTFFFFCDLILRHWWDELACKQPLQWGYNERNGVSTNRRLDWLLNRLFRRKTMKVSKLRVIGLCEGNPPVTGVFPAQKASNAANVFIWWRHHETTEEVVNDLPEKRNNKQTRHWDSNHQISPLTNKVREEIQN